MDIETLEICIEFIGGHRSMVLNLIIQFLIHCDPTKEDSMNFIGIILSNTNVMSVTLNTSINFSATSYGVATLRLRTTDIDQSKKLNLKLSIFRCD